MSRHETIEDMKTIESALELIDAGLLPVSSVAG